MMTCEAKNLMANSIGWWAFGFGGGIFFVGGWYSSGGAS